MTEEAQAVEADATTAEASTPDVAAPETTQAEASWLDSLGDHKGYVENKGWKDPATVVESYRNLEKLRGVPQERLLTLPEDMSEDGALDDVFDRLGRPEAADKYTNAIGDEYADDTFKAAAERAHNLGLTDKQFAGMQEWMKESFEALDARRTEEVDGAFNDWSQANPAALQNVQRMLKAVGADAGAVDAALQGDKAQLFNMLGKVASRMGESEVVQGDGDPEFGMTPTAAQAKIDQLLADKTFTEGYFNQNAKVRAPYMARMEKLQKIAAGSQ